MPSVGHALVRVTLLTLAAAQAFGAIAGRSLPIYFFEAAPHSPSEILFMAEAPEIRAGFGYDSVRFDIKGHSTRVRFVGAEARANVEPADPMPGHANFLIGRDESGWRTNVPLYRNIVYRNLYPGIDLKYSGAGMDIKSEFLVSPGADASRVRLSYSGEVSIDPNGDLVVTTGDATLRELAPMVFQDSPLGRQDVPGRYQIFQDGTVGFEIGTYDRSRPLIIDPVISYATYFGGSLMTDVTGIATDGTGAVYVTGWTESLDFPTAGAVQASNHGGVDAFVAKLNAAGTALLYATYIGGNSDDRAAAIAVDNSGEAYVTGSTASTNFPVVLPIRSSLGGGRNAFALKLNAAGSMLLYSTYLGGTVWDEGNAIAVDTNENAYIAGDTQSPNFPTLNPVQPTFGGVTDAFVTKLTASGALAFSTFLGGSNAEHAAGIAVDSSANIYVAGGTYSQNFPVVNAIQASNAGSEDIFLAKISGSSLAYSTYLGGAQADQANAIAIDASGNAYLAGVTSSTNFPATSGALRTVFNGMQDAFVARVASGGAALTYATFLGGSTSNLALSIAVDAGRDAYVAGNTSSVDFPLVNPVQLVFGGMLDAFVSEINPAGTALLWSTFYGGSGSDSANSIALDSSGDIFIGGQTNSGNFPLQSALKSLYTGSPTGFLLKLSQSVLPSPSSPSPANGATGIATSSSLSWSASGATSFDVYFGTSSAPSYIGSTTSTSYAPGSLSAGQTYYWYVVARNGGIATASPVWSFTTLAPVLSAPSSPSPANGATGVSTSISLSWSSSGATSYQIYFGTSSSPSYVGTTTSASYSPGSLSPNQVYYWEVVAYNGSNLAASPVWSFTTQTSYPVVANGGFESGLLSPWLTWTGTASVTTTAHTGTYGLMMSGTAEVIVYQEMTGLTPGQIYQVSVWIKGPNPIPNGALLDLQGSSGAVSTYTITPAPTWQQLSGTFVVPADGIMYISLIQWSSTAGATTYWDDVTIGAPAAPSSSPANGGFESGLLSPWLIWTGTASVTTTAHTGTYGLMMSGTAEVIVYQEVTGLTPGQIYQVSVWIKGPNPIPNGALLDLQGSSGAVSTYTITPAPTWQQLSGTFVVPADGIMYISLIQWSSTAGATTYWDDVSIH